MNFTPSGHLLPTLTSFVLAAFYLSSWYVEQFLYITHTRLDCKGSSSHTDADGLVHYSVYYSSNLQPLLSPTCKLSGTLARKGVTGEYTHNNITIVTLDC